MKNLLTLTFSILLASTAWAQSADEYFHGGAQSFISADLQTAIKQVQNGLNNYPNDPKLNALMQKLQEEQEKQQQQQQQNQDQQQQNQQQQERQQEQEEQDQEEQEQEQQQSEGENQEEQDPQEMNPEDLKSQQISKEDAEKILQALAQKEKELLKEFKKKKSEGSAKHDKDW
jgi:outer membrane biosynthesis protein TonB